MRPSVIWIAVIVGLAALLLYLVAGTQPAGDGSDTTPSTPPHAVTDG
ncbi:hypothetical protein [Pseudotabrizicola alkalilacus]|nr:hypothetical protein [Pseudotabrizicola alkalilacus]